MCAANKLNHKLSSVLLTSEVHFVKVLQPPANHLKMDLNFNVEYSITYPFDSRPVLELRPVMDDFEDFSIKSYSEECI